MALFLSHLQNPVSNQAMQRDLHSGLFAILCSTSTEEMRAASNGAFLYAARLTVSKLLFA